MRGWLRTAAGDADRDVEHFEMSMRLDPCSSDRGYQLSGIALARFGHGRSSEAAALLREVLQLQPTASINQALLEACYGQMGETDAAPGPMDSASVVRFAFSRRYRVSPMNLRLASRYIPFALAIVGLAVSLVGYRTSGNWLVPALFFGALTAVGIADLLQPHSTLRRIYPLSGRLRYLLESIGPEFRQYFIESDNDAVPFSREQRAGACAGAAGKQAELDARPGRSRPTQLCSSQ